MKLIAYYAELSSAPKKGKRNWRENYINDRLYYSHRDTQYEKSTYPSTLHYHDYYELVIFVRGDIHYICENESYRPQYGDVLVVPPGCVHMSMIDGDTTRYERHVFYLYPDALDGVGASALSEFLHCGTQADIRVFSVQNRNALLSLLSRLDSALETEAPSERALALSFVLQAFYEILHAGVRQKSSEGLLPESVLEIRRYIDTHYSELESVGEIASHFYYSREYVSRLFKQYFNTTVADYLRTRRVAAACTLIAQGISLSEVCFRVGFGNLTTFIRSFRAVTGQNPSAYRALR